MEEIAPIKRIAIGREKHPTTGTDHYHVYVEWINKVNLKGTSGRGRLLVRGYGVHVSKHRKGLAGARYCYEYATKDGDYWESDGFDLFCVSRNFVKESNDYDAWRYYR